MNPNPIIEYFNQDTFYKFLLDSTEFLNKERAVQSLYIKWVKNNPVEFDKYEKWHKMKEAHEVI